MATQYNQSRRLSIRTIERDLTKSKGYSVQPIKATEYKNNREIKIKLNGNSVQSINATEYKNNREIIKDKIEWQLSTTNQGDRV